MTSAEAAIAALLWLVALVQVPAALRSAWKLLPLTVFTGVAFGDTVNLPAVIMLIDRGTGIADLATLLKHLSTAIALSALLDWVITLERARPAGRRLRWWHAFGAAVLVTLVTLFFLTPRTETPDFTVVEKGGYVTAYLLVFEGYLAIASAATAWRFRRAARSTRPGALRRSIMILFAGALAGAAYGTAEVAILAFRYLTADAYPAGTLRAIDVVSPVLQIGAALIITGMLTPTAMHALHQARRLTAYRALYPLWRSLAAEAPGIVLAQPPRRIQLTGSGLEILMIRRVAEIRDGIMLMHRRVGPGTLTQARTLLAGSGLRGTRLDAAAEACAIELGLAIRSRPASTRTGAPVPPVPGGTDLAGEIAWLLAVCAARGTPPVRQAASYLAATAAQPERTS